MSLHFVAGNLREFEISFRIYIKFPMCYGATDFTLAGSSHYKFVEFSNFEKRHFFIFIYISKYI